MLTYLLADDSYTTKKPNCPLSAVTVHILGPKLKSCFDWVSTSWCRAHCGTWHQILILSEMFCLVSVGHPLWRKIGSISRSPSQSYFTTDGQQICIGIEPTLGLATRYYFLSECCFLKVEVLFLLGALSGERMGLQFAVQSLNDLSNTELVTILYCLIWDSLNREGQAVFVSPRNRVAQIYPRHWVPFKSPLATRRTTVQVF
jgi:hypothetical protein